MNDANSVPVDETIVTNTEFEESLKRSFSYFKKKRLNKHERIYRPVLESEEVRSVQRFILPNGKDAAWVASEYMTWLPKFLSFLVFRVKSTDEFISFNLFGVRLLVLKFSPDRSSTSRQLFYIAGGFLLIIVDEVDWSFVSHQIKNLLSLQFMSLDLIFRGIFIDIHKQFFIYLL